MLNDKFINRIATKVGDIYDLTADEARQIVRACCVNSGRFNLYEFPEAVTAITLDGMSARKYTDNPDCGEWSDVEISANFCGQNHRIFVSLTNETYGDYTLACCWRLDDQYIPLPITSGCVYRR